MVRLYISKNQYFTNRNFPINDYEVWNNPNFKKYLYLHDKYLLSKKLNYSCGLINGNNPVIPLNNFPIFIRPRINKEGMGNNAFKVKDQDELHYILKKNFKKIDLNKMENNENEKENNENEKENKNIDNNFDYFWTCYILPVKPIQEKIHLSYDMVLINGECVFQCIFKGHKINDIEFSYWELVSEPEYFNNKFIMKILEEELSDFTGIVNLEILEGFIIEMHLRMGDIYHLPKISPYILQLYHSHKWEYPIINLELLNLYLFAVWGSPKIAQALQQDPTSHEKIIEILKEAVYYQFLTNYLNNDKIRIFFFKVYDYHLGLKIQKDLYNLLANYDS